MSEHPSTNELLARAVTSVISNRFVEATFEHSDGAKLKISLRSRIQPNRNAVIDSFGTGAFFLSLNRTFELTEIDNVVETWPETVAEITGIACDYLDGNYVEILVRRRWGRSRRAIRIVSQERELVLTARRESRRLT